ncbi:MAG: dihydrofolate reductase family protein, partial [Gaiellaceae bacterium]
MVGGPGLVRQLLLAGLVDELRIDLMPVLLGSGLRFLEDPRLEQIQLEKIDVQEFGARISLSFRVQKQRVLPLRRSPEA